MKLEDIQNIAMLERDGGIFQHLFRRYAPTYLNNAVDLDYEYYLNRSGKKTLSPLFEKLYKFNEESILGTYAQLTSIINNKFGDKWARLYSAMVKTEYNPIENYNSVEVENVASKITSKTKATNDVYGFNSTDAVPSTENGTETETGGNADENERRLTRSGNIGVTTTQQMLESEIELRKKNFYDILFKDVDTLLTIEVYD